MWSGMSFYPAVRRRCGTQLEPAKEYRFTHNNEHHKNKKCIKSLSMLSYLSLYLDIYIDVSMYLYIYIKIYVLCINIYIYTHVIISVCISVWIHKAPEVEANCSRCTYLLHMHGTCQEGRNFQSFCAARHETGSCPGSVAGTLGCNFQDILVAHPSAPCMVYLPTFGPFLGEM